MSSIKFSADFDNSKLEAGIKQSTRSFSEWAKNVEKTGGVVDKTVQRTNAEFKDAIRQEREFIRGIEKEIKDLEKALDKATTGKGKKEVLTELSHAKKVLAESQADLNRLQQEQIELSQKEAEAADSLTGKISKWALGLGGAAAALKVLEKAFKETVQGQNIFNMAGAATKQFLYDIVSGAGLSSSKIQQAIVLQRELNNLRLEEYNETLKATQYNNEYQQLYSDSLDATLSRAEKLKIIDAALAAHNKAIDIEVQNVNNNLELVKKGLNLQPTNEKLFAQYTELNNKLLNLDAERVSSVKRLTRTRSILIKEGIDEELEWRKDLHDKLQKLANEQIEIDKENANKLRDLRNEIAALKTEGMDRELLELKQKYEIDMKTYEGNEKIKIALTEKYEAEKFAIEKKWLEKYKDENEKLFTILASGSKFGVLDRAISGSNPSPANSSKPTLQLGKLAPFGQDAWDKKNDKAKKDLKDQNELTEDQLKLRKEIADAVARVTWELGQQIGLDEQAQRTLDATLTAVQDALSGNLISAAATMLSQLIAAIPTHAQQFAFEIENINKLLAEQERLIEKSERVGNEKGETQKQLELLKQERDKIAAEIAKTQKKLGGFFGQFFAATGSAKRLDDLKAQLEDIDIKIEETRQNLDDLWTGGLIETDIAGIIETGFREGSEAGAEEMDSVMKSALSEIFKKEILGPQITETVNWLRDALSNNEFTASEKAEWESRIKQIADDNKQIWDSLTQAYDFSNNEKQSALTGIARAITEETGSELLGLTRRGIDDIRTMRDYSKMGVEHLVKIEANTYNTVLELEKANTKLDEVITNTKPAYSGGL